MDNNDLIRRGDVDDILARVFGFAEDEGEEIAVIKINDELKQLPAVDAVEVDGATKQAIELIVGERHRQVEQWGDQVSNHPYEWMSILGEEFGELCRAVNETCFQNPREPELGGNDNIISEAVQVATVAIAIIESCLDQRREDGDA